MIVLYEFEISPFCDKIRRVLNVKGVPFRTREVKLAEAGRLKHISPTGKFPAIDHDGRIVADSTEIARYLDSRFPEPALIPADPAHAARVHVLEDWADEALYFIEMTMRLAWDNNARRWAPEVAKYDSGLTRALAPVLVPRFARAQARAQGAGRKSREQILKEVERHATALEAMLEGGAFLTGPALTLADIAVYAQFACICGAEEGASLLKRHGRLADWMTRVDAATAKRA